MKLLINGIFLFTILKCLNAQVGSSADADNYHNIYKREDTTEPTTSTFEELDPTTVPPTKVLPNPPPPKAPVPVGPGAATGAGAGAGSASGIPGAFPFFPIPYWGGFYQPFPYFDFNQYNQQFQQWMQQGAAQAQQAAARHPFGPYGPFPQPFYGAAAQGSFGPQGGFGTTFINPPPKNGEGLTYHSFNPPPPGSNQFGVSTFASSSFSDVNGDKKGTKYSEVSINDNGNITTYVSSDPKNANLQLGNIPPPPPIDNSLPLFNNFYRT